MLLYKKAFFICREKIVLGLTGAPRTINAAAQYNHSETRTEGRTKTLSDPDTTRSYSTSRRWSSHGVFADAQSYDQEMMLHSSFSPPHIRDQGVTLIELLTVIAIVAILAAIGVPSFQETIVRNRMAAQSNEFLSALNFARSEAIKRGHSVTLCRSTNATSCASTGGWESGWLAFSDPNGNGTMDTGDASIRVWVALSAGFTLKGNTGVAGTIRYDARGMAQNTGHLLMCKSSQINGARAIIVTTARPRVSYSGDQTAPKNDTGTNYTSCTP